jgi:hypothetical protein
MKSGLAVSFRFFLQRFVLSLRLAYLLYLFPEEIAMGLPFFCDLPFLFIVLLSKERFLDVAPRRRERCLSLLSVQTVLGPFIEN